MTGPGPHNAGSTPQPPQSPHQLKQDPPAAGGSRRNLIVAVAVIALIVIIGLVVWLVTKRSPDQGAPQTGSIQQPAVSSAGGYTPIDPASMIAPGLKVPSDVNTFLDATAIPAFMKYANDPSDRKTTDPTLTSCWYGTGAENKWYAPQFEGSTGYVVCGPTRNDTGVPAWWIHHVSVDANGMQSLVKADGVPARWGPAGKVPAGFRPDGRPLSAAG